jgi:GTPase SAR1 family protein
MREVYFRIGKILILMYSVTSRITFENTTEFINHIKEIKKDEKDYLIILVGNKIDVARKNREVTYLDGLMKAREFDLPFIEMSAEYSLNMKELFTIVGELYLCLKEEPNREQ